MPSDTPVLTVLDPKNVAAACARILGLADESVQSKVKAKIEEIKKGFDLSD
jgi:phosphoribosylcarboxyaminoimidazole (NCAIR) mutase